MFSLFFKKPDSPSLIETKIMLNQVINALLGRSWQLFDGNKKSTSIKGQNSWSLLGPKNKANIEQIIHDVRQNLWFENSFDPVMIQRNINEEYTSSFDSNVAQIGSQTIKEYVEILSETMFLKAAGQGIYSFTTDYANFMRYFVMELYRYCQNKQQYQDFIVECAANCLINKAGRWAGKHGGWIEAYNHDTSWKNFILKLASFIYAAISAYAMYNMLETLFYPSQPQQLMLQGPMKLTLEGAPTINVRLLKK